MKIELVRHIGVWVLASLAVAAVMVGEAVLQLGGRPVATAVCLLAPAVWATALACTARRRARG